MTFATNSSAVPTCSTTLSALESMPDSEDSDASATSSGRKKQGGRSFIVDDTTKKSTKLSREDTGLLQFKYLFEQFRITCFYRGI